MIYYRDFYCINFDKKNQEITLRNKDQNTEILIDLLNNKIQSYIYSDFFNKWQLISLSASEFKLIQGIAEEYFLNDDQYHREFCNEKS